VSSARVRRLDRSKLADRSLAGVSGAPESTRPVPGMASRSLRAAKQRRTPVPREGAVRVSDVQRARILAAMVRVVAEDGVGSATVARVVARAGVSRRTFYEQFSGSEDCFLAVFEDTISRASRIVSEAAAGAPPAWREQLRAGLSALLAFFDSEPLSGRLLVVDALGAGPAVLERRTRVMRALATIVDRGRTDAKHGRGTTASSSSSSSSSPPPLTAEGIVGAVLSVIHARMFEHCAGSSTNGSPRSGSRHGPASLSGLLSPLMAMIVLPYLGAAGARKELARPAPKIPRTRASSSAPREPSVDPLQGLNMRLTYRTLLVLSAIATDPGASNRQIADHSGIHDQGQISKLLTRLQRLGLIHNTGHGQAHGEPNAWTLTPHGTEIQRALATGG
jgi:AcrR family transcriptional regulator